MTVSLPECPASVPAAILPLIAVLRQLADVIAALSDDQYRANPVGPVASSIGGHVRHCLDHVDALLTGLERRAVDYDQRQRGTDVETSCRAALAAIERQVHQLHAFPPRSEDWSLRLTALVNIALPPVETETTVGRELVFVLSHTIHHNALVAIMAKTLGVPLPDRFGYAPSTVAHLEKRACVR